MARLKITQKECFKRLVQMKDMRGNDMTDYDNVSREIIEI